MYIRCMRAITIKVSEPVYSEFKRYAEEHDRTASELIREAMEEYLERRLHAGARLADLAPLSLGKVLRDTTKRGDLLTEMAGDDRP